MERILINTVNGVARTINAHYTCMNADSVSKKPHTSYGFVRTAVAVPITDKPEDERVPVGTTDGGKCSDACAPPTTR